MSTAPSSLNRRAAYASITLAATLVLIKGWAAWTTGSVAMLGSLADTALDLVSSIATLAGVWVAGQPDDANHRVGHGKAEALSARFPVVLIAASHWRVFFSAAATAVVMALVSWLAFGTESWLAFFHWMRHANLVSPFKE